MRLRQTVRFALIGAFLALVALTVAGAGGHRLGVVLYQVLIAASAVTCLAAVCNARGRERRAVLALGLGLCATVTAELLWVLHFGTLAEPPYPSLADGFWLAWAPLTYIGFSLLAGPPEGRAQWLDGAIAGVAAAALGAWLLVPLAAEVEGAALEVATNLAYPVLDVLLLVLVASTLVATRRRLDRRMLAATAALCVGAVADVLYFHQSLRGTYTEGSLIDLGWPASALLTALAATLPSVSRGAAKDAGGSAWRALLIPAGAGLVVVALVVADHVSPLPTAAFALTLAALALVVARSCWTLAEHARMLERSRREALEDALTGLGNRRALERALSPDGGTLAPGDRRTLVLFDLDGFKHYNDSFGHPAGDQLLVRLGAKLRDACADHGAAFRMGGDEFCALLAVDADHADDAVARTAAALREQGETFAIGASYGAVVLGREAHSPESALQLADARLYEAKSSGRAGAQRQARDVLLAALSEREPDLHEHLTGTAALAVGVAEALGLVGEERDEVARAAELHDVGKVAIPEAILHKPGPLNAAERAFMDEHTIIGERILAAAPALRPVARLVRSSHERWDGTGYPDALAGEAIPLGARIVAVCDAFDAMVSDRPYRRGRSLDAAVAELRRCAGGQFDPRVVAAFCIVVNETDVIPRTESALPHARAVA